jgi:hypothetical protein
MQNADSILILHSISGWKNTYITASEGPDRLWAHTASYSRGTGVGQVLKMIMSVPRWRMGKSTPLLPHMTLWREQGQLSLCFVSLKTRNKLEISSVEGRIILERICDN